MHCAVADTSQHSYDDADRFKDTGTLRWYVGDVITLIGGIAIVLLASIGMFLQIGLKWGDWRAAIVILVGAAALFAVFVMRVAVRDD